MASGPSHTGNAEEKNEGEEDKILEAAIQSVRKLYPTKPKLCSALKNAKKRLEDLVKERAELERRILKHQNILDTIEENIALLYTEADDESKRNDENVDTTDAAIDVDLRNEFANQLLSGVKDYSETPSGYERTKEKVDTLKARIQRAKMFVEIVQGAQSVPKVQGVKRSGEKIFDSDTDDESPAKIRRV